MSDTKPFPNLTSDAARFAVREYFRPILAAYRLFCPLPPTDMSEEPIRTVVFPDEQTSLEEAKSLVRERLATGRRHEKFLLLQCLISAFASLIAVAISLTQAFDLNVGIALVVIVVLSMFTIWVTLRIVKQREAIIELKTIHWIIKSVNEETAGEVAKQVLWGKSKTKRSPREKKRVKRDKKPI